MSKWSNSKLTSNRDSGNVDKDIEFLPVGENVTKVFLLLFLRGEGLAAVQFYLLTKKRIYPVVKGSSKEFLTGCTREAIPV
ncbi:uncharacterized protein OCT59_002475 [Rhizophagus irregularis]|uniref:uncharacterized protein n=1 Tax=Rhizophagus irregularis TaxID=588596 RepID=UPI0019FC2C12|nr:hypothetical protein OCT59_002475 [Rhizophagus irregularis]GET57205.1 hypothetical protein RIR_jg26752.t1 [Rhizophagus irregularis DAOM 181602=DAOM 197198]